MPISYAFLTRVADPVLKSALKILMDRVSALETQVVDIGMVSKPLTANFDAANHRLMSVAAPVAATDAVNLRTLQTYVESRLNAAGLIDASGQATTPTDSDNGETARGVADAGGTGHIAAGELTAYRAGLIIGGVGHEFPALVAPAADEATFDANRLELLLRTIWHLAQSGFTVGRQRNPSGILSTDKIAVVESGSTRAFDVYTGTFTAGITVQAIQVVPANLVPDAGTPD